MGCSFGGDKIVFEIEFAPAGEVKVEEVGLIGDDEFP